MSGNKSPWASSGGASGGSGGGKSPWGSGNQDRGSRGPGGRPPQADLDNVIKGFKSKFGRGGGKKGGGKPQTGGFPKSIFIIGALALLLYLSIFTVQAEEEAVVLRFGEYKRTAKSGLHFKLPYPIESKIKQKVTTQRETTIGFRGARDVPKESLMLTGDENIVDIDFTVFWRISNLEKYLFNIDDPEKLVKEMAESVMREVIGRNDLDSIITTQREQLRTVVQSQLQTTLDEYEAGVKINEVQFQKTDPPAPVINSFLDVVNAAQDAETAINQAEAYANKKILEAEGAAAKMVQEAEAYKERVIAEATGEAERFRLVYEEYRAAPRVTRQRLYLEAVEEIYSDAEKIILDSDAGSGVVPYLPLNELSGKRGGNQ